MIKIGINGLGRIGRLAFRAIQQQYSDKLQVVAACDRNPYDLIKPLLRRDSIYGLWDTIPDIQFFLNNPQWYKTGVDVLLDCAGGGPDGNKARGHLQSGVKKVIISAPAPNVDATLVLGANEETYQPDKHHVVSMASCTSNCVAPILAGIKPLELQHVHIVSVNAYTNSQRLVDAPHNDPRCARSGALNIIPTESSTAKSLPLVLPWLAGKYSGIAFRVPVACGSVCHLDIDFERDKNVAEVSLIRGINNEIIKYSYDPLVSTDIIGDSHSAIIDSQYTRLENNRFHLTAWYDNEWAYACRLAEMAIFIMEKAQLVNVAEKILVPLSNQLKPILHSREGQKGF